MEIELDKDRCTGHARCHAKGPSVYDLDDDGFCVLVDARVPVGLEAQAREGAAACPETALRLSGE